MLNQIKKLMTTHTTNFCPKCKAYSGEAFKILSEGENLKSSETLKCISCGWIGFWDECHQESGNENKQAHHKN